jgi:hypothetical protein
MTVRSAARLAAIGGPTAVLVAWIGGGAQAQLLDEQRLAHRRAPRSPWRPYTLFATVFGETPDHGLGVMPDVRAARAYETEFPHGPFIRDVYRTLADFHKDLYMVLRDRLRDFKYDCFAPHITTSPRASQEARARAVAIDYYERGLRLAPADDDARTFVQETRAGTVRGWSFCAD